MDTYFAPSQRATEQEIKAGIGIVIGSPVVQGLMQSINGLLAVLDEHRQVVALNDSFLQMLGITDPGESLGLRPGEILQCIYAKEEPGGCGTTKYCSTCGAAIAIVAAMAFHKPVDRICALAAKRGGALVDISLLVRAHHIIIDEKMFVLLFLQDITLEQQRAALERTFFHDINNMLTGLLGASEWLSRESKDSQVADIVYRSALRLCNEVAIQKYLFLGDVFDYQVSRQLFTTEELLADLRNVFFKHAASVNKKLFLVELLPPVSLNTDISLVLRVMCNMVTNALEATDEQGTVKCWFEQDDDQLVFSVWNSKSITEEVSLRIFQRNYSTKTGDGRGIGTYSMKLLGEKLLGGRVSFSSSEKDGTLFRFALSC